MRQKTIEIAKETMNRDVFIRSTGKYYAIMMPLDIYCRYEGMKYMTVANIIALLGGLAFFPFWHVSFGDADYCCDTVVLCHYGYVGRIC